MPSDLPEGTAMSVEAAGAPVAFGRPDPGGTLAEPSPLESAASYCEELLAVVQLRLAAAIHARWQSGLLVETGDASSALFLDRGRVEALLAGVVSAAGAETLADLRRVAEGRYQLLERRLAASRRRGQAIPLADAADAWELSDAERLLCGCLLGAEVSPTLARLLSYLGGDAMRPGLPVEAAAAVLGASHGGVLAASELLEENARLRRLSLVYIAGWELPLQKRMLRAAPRLIALARGSLGIDDRLAGAELLRAEPPGLLAPFLPHDVLAGLTAVCGRRTIEEPIGIVVSRRGVGAARVVAEVAAATGRRALVLPLAGRPLDDELFAIAIREALLHHAMLVVIDDGAGDPAREAAMARFLERLAAQPGPAVLVIERVDAVTPRPRVAMLRVDIPVPDAAVRFELWSHFLGLDAATAATAAQGTDTEAGGRDLDAIASAYNVGLETIERAAAAARALAREDATRRVGDAHVATALRAQVASDLSSIATHMEVTQTWDDLILTDETSNLVNEFVLRARQRRRVFIDWGFGRKVGKGLGLVALFSGRPGTGKSMVAGLIARELGLDAFQIDISRIMSKWIGETEKSLAVAFEAAEAGQALLIFDEADALFGKRVSDVKSSTDRYANVETNYILNRLESFSGVAVLTTNLEGNLDPAFRRRVSLHAQFPFPDEEHRELLWQTIIPAETPLDGTIPFARLARDYKLSGGQIRNVALRAAFLAASADEPLSAKWIDVAIDRQYAAYGKLTAGGELE